MSHLGANYSYVSTLSVRRGEALRRGRAEPGREGHARWAGRAFGRFRPAHAGSGPPPGSARSCEKRRTAGHRLNGFPPPSLQRLPPLLSAEPSSLSEQLRLRDRDLSDLRVQPCPAAPATGLGRLSGHSAVRSAAGRVSPDGRG